jgi:hypothetical protein
MKMIVVGGIGACKTFALRVARWVKDGGLNFFQPAEEEPEPWEDFEMEPPPKKREVDSLDAVRYTMMRDKARCLREQIVNTRIATNSGLKNRPIGQAVTFSFDLAEYVMETYGEGMTRVEAVEWIKGNVVPAFVAGEPNWRLFSVWGSNTKRQTATFDASRVSNGREDYRKVKSQRAKYRRLSASKRARMRGVKK